MEMVCLTRWQISGYSIDYRSLIIDDSPGSILALQLTEEHELYLMSHVRFSVMHNL